MNSDNSSDQQPPQLPGEVDFPAGYLHSAQHLVIATQRELRIYSELLEADVYGEENFVSSLSAMVRANRRSHARVLVSPRADLAGRSHRLLDLARSVPSLCQCRIIAEPADRYREDFILADREGYVSRKAQEEKTAWFAPGDRAGAADRADHFDYLWSRANTCVELRHLSI